jgi:hypothetical protein
MKNTYTTAETMKNTYTTAEMLELVHLHFTTEFAGAVQKWDWSIPFYLLEGVEGWTPARLEALVDRYHNGPARCR